MHGNEKKIKKTETLIPDPYKLRFMFPGDRHPIYPI
jgi:hypothetical protein